MMVIPAIDLMDGHAVRLAEGDRERKTVYSDAPWELAASFVEAGARRLHVVDLDGAFAGVPTQLDLVERIIDVGRAGGCAVEVGGGIRDPAAATTVLDRGADFVVIGTMAVREPGRTAQLCGDYPGRVIVAIDARNGEVAVDGWREGAGIEALELAKRAQAWGAAGLLHTDVTRDGLQVGPAVEATAALQRELSIPVIASGGVGTLADLHALRAADVFAVVVGRALYEGAFSVEEALEVAC